MNQRNRCDASARAQRNVLIVFFLRFFFSTIAMVVPTIVAFWQAHGMSMFEVLALEACFAICVVCGEIPSGYVADLLGRKRALIAGGTTVSISLLAYTLADDFSGFLVAELLIAVGISVISGADEALLYDSLRETGEEINFTRYWGRISSIEMALGSLGLMLGGVLAAEIDLRAPFYAALVAQIGYIAAACLLSEPKREKVEVQHGHCTEVLALARRILIENPRTRMVIGLSALLFGFCQTCFWIVQPYLKETGVELSYNGFILAALGLGGSIFTSQVRKLEGKISIGQLSIALIFVVALSFFGLGMIQSSWAVTLVLIHQFVRASHRILYADALHKEIDSSLRATSISVRGMVDRAFYALVLLAAGSVIDSVGTFDTLLLMGGVLALLGGALLVVGLRGSERRQMARRIRI